MPADSFTSRRSFVVAVAGLAGTLSASLAARAQTPTRVVRLGFLRPGAPPKTFVEAFRQGLRERGYLEGQNVAIEYRVVEGSLDDVTRFAAELAQLKVDVILASAGLAALAAKTATTTVPIVFVGVFDPVEAGLVTSLSRPGGNITGLSVISADLAGKRLELLREVVPKLVRVGVIWDTGNPINVIQLKGAKAMAAKLAIPLRELPVRVPADFEPAFNAARGLGGLLCLESPLFTTHRARLVELAFKSRLPAIYNLREFVDAGGLMSYGADAADLYRRAAAYVDKIVRGAKPGEIPVEQPTKFDLVVNVKTAHALGLTIPSSLMLRADHVIQ
jgi:putative ABC transport system substrate-binding protein